MKDAYTKRLKNPRWTKKHRQQLRSNLTEPERLFWSWVRSKQLGTKFRRQYGINNYIVDFYCPEFNLIIELDGDSHYITEEAQQEDNKRDDFLRSKGYQIIRFCNDDVMHNKEGVLSKLTEKLV